MAYGTQRRPHETRQPGGDAATVLLGLNQTQDPAPASAGKGRRSLIWRFGPVAIWMALVFWASTEQFSSEHTAQMIEPWIVWLFPRMEPETVNWLHAVIRKSAHVTEYAILACLLARALMDSYRPLHRGRLVTGCLLLAALAAADEFHQTFVPSRTAALTDVLIDTSGGLTALAAIVVWRRRRPAVNHKDKSSANESPGDFDITDDGRRVIVRIDAPGFDTGEFDVNFRGQLLILRALKRIEGKSNGRDAVKQSFQELYRCARLPAPVDAEKAMASYWDGVLTVTLPKIEVRTTTHRPVEASRKRSPVPLTELTGSARRRLHAGLRHLLPRAVERDPRSPHTNGVDRIKRCG